MTAFNECTTFFIPSFVSSLESSDEHSSVTAGDVIYGIMHQQQGETAGLTSACMAIIMTRLRVSSTMFHSDNWFRDFAIIIVARCRR
jgi:hypothetical protein